MYGVKQSSSHRGQCRVQCGPGRQRNASVGISMAQGGTSPDERGLGLELARWNYPGRIHPTSADISVAPRGRPRPRHARLYRVVSKSSAGEPRIDVSIGVFDRCRRLYYRICFRSFTRTVISPTCHGATTCGQCTSFCGRDRTTYGHLGRRELVLGENLWPLSFLKGRPNHLVQRTGPTVWPCSGDSIVWPFSL